jgi:hypothetical protein
MENVINGFGEHSPIEFQNNMEELNKALGTGQDGEAYGNGAYADMSAIRPQSLEPTLKIVTAQEKNIKFWKSIGKKQAFNTVEEFNVMDSYGGNSSPFFTEGGLPNEEDSNYIRQSQMVKFLGTTRVITHPATLVRNTVGDMVAQQQTAGTMWLLMQLEKALYFGNSALDPLAFDGVITQITNFVAGKAYQNQHVIDMRGLPLDENTLEDISTIVADNYGSGILDLHLTNQVNKDLSKLIIANGGATSRQRFEGGQGSAVTLGAPVRGYSANNAEISFVNNIFLKPQTAPLASSQRGAPAVPTLDATTPIAAGTDATAKHTAATYYYFVSAKNSAGESAPVATAAQAVTTAQAVTIKINRVVSDPVAKSYKVYRGVTSVAAEAQFAFEVADAGAGGTQNLVDRNFDIPGTDTAVLIDNDADQVLTFKQLAPLMKLPLARISASERFMILLYGMVQVYNPRRCVVIKNIGKLGINSNRELFAPSYGATSFGTVKPVAR